MKKSDRASKSASDSCENKEKTDEKLKKILEKSTITTTHSENSENASEVKETIEPSSQIFTSKKSNEFKGKSKTDPDIINEDKKIKENNMKSDIQTMDKKSIAKSIKALDSLVNSDSVENDNKIYDLFENSVNLTKLYGEKPASSDPLISKYSKTSIINPYKEYSPSFEKLYDKNCKIYKVTLAKTGQKFILKVVKSTKTTKLNRLIREYYNDMAFGTITDRVAKVMDIKYTTVENETIVEMLFEYAGEDLENSIKFLDSEKKLSVIYQLIIILNIMEEAGIAHFDLKPANIAYNMKTSILKLIDFGTAISFYLNPDKINKKLAENAEKFCEYTKAYAPPEILESAKKGWTIDNKKTILPQSFDCFSFGIIFAQLLLSTDTIKELPERDYSSESHKLFLKQIEELFANKNEIKCWIPLILKCLDFNSSERLDFCKIKDQFEEILKMQGLYDSFATKPEILSALGMKIDIDKIINMCINLHEYEAVIYHCNKLIKNYDNGTKPCTQELATTYVMRGLAELSLGEKTTSIADLLKSVEIYKKLEQSESDLIASAYMYLGDAYLKINRFNESSKNYEASLKIFNKKYGEKHQNVAIVKNSLGLSFQKLGKYELAVTYFKQSIETMKNLKEDETIHMVRMYNNLAEVYIQLCEYKLAAENFENSLKLYFKLYQEENLLITNIYINLSVVMRHLMKFDLSEDYCKKAINFLKKSHDEEHYSLAKAYNNLGLVYYSREKYDDAIYNFKESLKISKEDNLEVAHVYINLGNVYYNRAEYDIGIENYMKGIDLLEKAYGGMHPDLASAYNNLGEAYLQLKKYDKAVENHEKSIEINKKYFEEDHPSFAFYYENFASLYRSMEKYEAALGYCKKALVIFTKIYGDDCENVASTYNNIGSILCNLDKFEESVENLLKALLISQKIFGEKNSLTELIRFNLGSSYCCLGNAYYNVKKYQDAIEKYQEAICNYEKINENSDLAIFYSKLGSCYFCIENYKEALKYYELAITLFEKGGEKNEGLAQTYENLADNFLHMKNEGKFEEYLEKAKEMYEKLYGNESYKIMNMYFGFGKTYLKKKDKYDKAIKYFLIAETILDKIMKKTENQREILIDLYKNIAVAFWKIKDLQMAQKYIEKCELANK